MDFFPWERAARYIFPAKFFSPQLLKTVSSLDGKTAVNLAIANIRYYLSAWQIVRYRFSPEAEEELRRKDRARVEKFAAFIHGASSEKADDGHSIQAASPTPSENLDSINLPPAKAITSRLSLLNSADPLQEGSRRLVIRDQIERNPAARRICLAHHGYRCAVCGIDLGKEFGEEFEGLIEVHHLTPLSESPEQHEVDPRADLIPLCPTCHRMAHWKTKTPRTAEDLRRIVQHER